MDADALGLLRSKAAAMRRLPPPEIRRGIRISAGVSQLDIAVAVKCSVAAVCRWEAGSRTPRGDLLERYLAVLAALGAP